DGWFHVPHVCDPVFDRNLPAAGKIEMSNVLQIVNLHLPPRCGPFILDSYTLECENLSLPFCAPDGSDKKMLSRQARPERCRRTISETNPKSEYRNPKQTQRQINLKSGKSKTPNPKEACLEFYIFWSFEIVSSFGFRASNFLFLAAFALVTVSGSSYAAFASRACSRGI